MWAAIIGGVSGLLTGVVGAILAPWAKWRVDREQATREWRRDRLAEWRTGLAEAERLPDALQDRDFLQSAWYASLRPHLTDEERQTLEVTEDANTIRVIVTSTVHHRHQFARLLANRIDALARAWELD